MAQLEVPLRNLARAGRISPDTVEEILSYSWDEISDAIIAVMNPVSQGYRNLISEEFGALIEGSVRGIPPLSGPSPKSPVVIEINPHLVTRHGSPNGTLFRVAPILKLRTVTVQKGYRREIGAESPSTVVDVSFADALDNQQRWYPGVEFLGEGIFILREENNGWIDEAKTGAAAAWHSAHDNPGEYPDFAFRDPINKDELHPDFVWWHTFSHLLLRVLSADSGYSTAALRERIYFHKGDDSTIRGGILLYATQPGSEGTLGGLIALAPNLGTAIRQCLANAQVCSGDPLCGQHVFKNGGESGAACYSCLLVSETSCEHRNMWLDRNVFLERPI
jgi:hypothetical protein